LGGTIRYQAEIDRITSDGGKVTGIRLKSGETFPADAIVSNADVVHTYRDMLKDEPKVQPTTKKLEKMAQSMSLVVIYFGTKKRYPELAHHNVIFGPRYKGLLEQIFGKRAKGASKVELPDDFSLYLHAPTVSDPSLAPEGCEAFYVLSPVAHMGHLDVDWSVEGPKYADKILDYLEERYLPGLRENLVTQRVFTPENFKTELNSHLGAAFSLEPVLTQSAFFRTHNRDEDIQGLYVVGAGTHPGAGVPGVVNSAKATAALVLEDFPRQ
ncbi:MAG: phytoene desaturase, partial [Proteobacteria bacterium]